MNKQFVLISLHTITRSFAIQMIDKRVFPFTRAQFFGAVSQLLLVANQWPRGEDYRAITAEDPRRPTNAFRLMAPHTNRFRDTRNRSFVFEATGRYLLIILVE